MTDAQSNETLHAVSEISERYGLEVLNPLIQACELLAKSNRISVAIVGRFKAGKSSFLNSILGSAILPTGVLPVTAGVTFIRYSETEKLVVTFLNGEIKKYAVAELTRFVAEPENPKNILNVAKIEIETPQLKKFRDLEFIDTPGLGSSFEHNSQATNEWLPNIAVALLTLSVDSPLSEQDVELLKELHKLTPKVIIVLTKIDLVSEMDRSKLIAFISQRLLEIFGTQFQIFPFSNQTTYRNLQDQIEKSIFIPLSSTHGTESQAILHHKINHLMTTTEQFLKIIETTRQRDESERQAIQSSIQKEKNNLQVTIKELNVLLSSSKVQTRDRIKQILGVHERRICERLEDTLSKEFSENSDNLWKLSRKFEDRVACLLKSELEILSKSNEASMLTYLSEAEAQARRSIESFRNRLSQKAEELFQVRWPNVDFDLPKMRIERPDISVSSSFDIKIDILWFLIPMPIFGTALKWHLLRLIPYEVQKNISRTVTQWSDLINAAISAIEKDGADYIGVQVATLEKVAEDKNTGLDEILTDLQRVRRFLSLPVSAP